MGYFKGMTPANISGSWLWRIGENRLVGDEVAAALFGFDPVRLKGGVPIEELRSVINPIDLELLDANVRQALAADQPYETQFRVSAGNGQERWLTSRGRCFLDEEGKPSEFVGSIAPDGPIPEAIPDLDVLTDRVIAAYKTAVALGDELAVHLLRMVLTDIGRRTAAEMYEEADRQMSGQAGA